MRVRIHHGAHEIGGNCVEVEHHGARLVLDVGRPLTAERGEHVPLPDIAGLARDDADPVLGVLISHYHLDHWGLIDQARAGLPIFMGEATERILRAAAFWTKGLEEPVAGHLEHRVPFELGPFTITPHLNDHSAFDAYSFLIEADGESLFYTGDIRGHGRKQSVFQQLLTDPPPGVDTLLMEGTNLQPGQEPKPVMPESAVEDQMVETFGGSEGIALVVTSAQNIDRLVTIYRAAKRTGRRLVMDPYSADIARATGHDTIPRPHPDWDQIDVYMPLWQSVRIKETEEFDRLEGVDGINSYRLFPEHLAEDPSKYVLMFSASDGPRLARAGALAGATCTYSLWAGYLDEPLGVRLRAFLDDHDIPLVHHHTSGHASVEDLCLLAEAIDAAQVVPIHTFGGQSFSEFVDNVAAQPDGVWWEVAPRSVPGGVLRPGYDVLVYVPYIEGLNERRPIVCGALARAHGGEPVWVDGWRDDDDVRTPEAAWEYYEEGYGVNQRNGVLSFRVRTVDEAAQVVDETAAELIESYVPPAPAHEPALEVPVSASPQGPGPDTVEIARVDVEALAGVLRGAALSSDDGAHLGPPWSVGIPQLIALLDRPDSHHWFPRRPTAGDMPEHGAAYWSPLLFMLLFRLGWVRPDRGLSQWNNAGRPGGEPHLDLLHRLWAAESDLDPFLAWAGQAGGYLKALHHAVGFTDEDSSTHLPHEWTDAVALREHQAATPGSPIIGGADPLHLTNILGSVHDGSRGAPQLLVDDWNERRAAMAIDGLEGWYRWLHQSDELLEIEQESDTGWQWEVLVRGLGSLGTYRRSPETGIFHATTERIHRWGVHPIDPDMVVVHI